MMLLFHFLSWIQLFCDLMAYILPGSAVCETSQASGLPFPSLGDLPNPGIEPFSCIGTQILNHWDN